MIPKVLLSCLSILIYYAEIITYRGQDERWYCKHLLKSLYIAEVSPFTGGNKTLKVFGGNRSGKNQPNASRGWASIVRLYPYLSYCSWIHSVKRTLNCVIILIRKLHKEVERRTLCRRLIFPRDTITLSRHWHVGVWGRIQLTSKF